MSLYPPPEILQAEVWTTLPDRFRIRDTSPDWAAANKPGRMIDSFLEGPSFDRDGNLWVTDIPMAASSASRRRACGTSSRSTRAGPTG
jgi:gluconolactonase